MTVTEVTGLAAIGKAQARAQIDRWLNEYADGTSNRRAEAVGLAQQAELNAAVVEARFAGAEKLRMAALAKPETPEEKIWVPENRAGVRARLRGLGPQIVDAALMGKGIGDKAQLDAAVAALIATKVEPVARSNEVRKPEPDPEPEPRAGEGDVNPPRLSRKAPLDSAKLFAAAKLYQRGALATYYYHSGWWQWNERFYAPIANDRITASVTLFLDSASVWSGDGEVRFKPKSGDTDELVKALRVHCLIEDEPPQWLDGRDADASRLLVFRNCLVDCETGEVSALTPKLWVHGGANIDYDPMAQCPRWEQFLEEVFPGDGESQHCIEEQLGYGMTNDTRFEKGAIWVGVKRSGKTTIAWVQEQLTGPGFCADLSFHDWVNTENSHAGIIGKKVGIFSDVRLKPAKTYGSVGYDPGGVDHKSAQLLLKIIGRDKMSIKTKYAPLPWEGRPTIKIIITSNVVPNLQDAGGVLASRFIKVAFQRSFAGKEDVNLRAKLAGELPGIAVRCLAAYRRLLQRGRFIQPRSAADLEAQIEAQANGFLQFMNECFEAGPNGKGVWVSTFYETFCGWCNENGRPDLKVEARTKQKLIDKINAIERFRNLKSTRTNSEPRRYPGIKLRKSFG